MVQMYMSDSDDDQRINGTKNGRSKPQDDSDESVMGFSDSDEDLDDQLSENQDDNQAQDQNDYDYDDFDEEEDEFGNVHAIRAKKQEMGSDIEDENEEYMPDARAWGTSIKNYIGSEYVDNDGEGITDKNRMIAEAEEEEGLAAQKRLLDQLEEDALDLDMFTSTQNETVDTKIETITKLDKLNKDDKLEYLKKDCPEIFLLMEDYKRLMSENENKIKVTLNQFKKHGKKKQDDLYQFLFVKRQLIMRYCLNINFYFSLKCAGKQLRTHPIRQALILYRKMIKEVQEYQEKMGYKNINELIQQLNVNLGSNKIENKTIIAKKEQTNKKRVAFEDEQQEADHSLVPFKKSKKSIPMSLQEEAEARQKAILKAENQVKKLEEEAEYYSDEHQDEKQVLFVHKRDNVKKRKINRMIEKNKGLTPYRRKDQSNPRLRYKKKHTKAEMKRRSQVSDPVKEINKYAGEYHGIKASTVRSVKIKQ